MPITPALLKNEFFAPTHALAHIARSRQEINNIMTGNDSRLLVIVGPCSIHDPIAAMEYATLLKNAAQRFADHLYIVMRVYFEKPRTNIGWKGLIKDPFLNGTFDINYGLKLARKLLINLAELGLPAGTEFLDPLVSNYFSDLISWGCIGARTSESQIHRELASFLEMPIGFKNTTDGNIKIAVEAVNTARYPHCFLGINQEGQSTIVHTTGNPNCHVVLRGSHLTPNFTDSYVQQTAAILKDANLPTRIMIDCSHGNSMKNAQRQHEVAYSVQRQFKKDASIIFGIMLESFLVAGKQNLEFNTPLTYGKSITDACLSWEETLRLLEKLATNHK